MSGVRLGLIGAGAVGVLHAQAATCTPGAAVTAVCDIDRQLAQRVGDRYGARAFVDHRELLDAGIVDAFVVNTPHALHTDIVCDAAAAGLHVLVEKPMATSVADCQRMIDACADAGVRLVVGHVQHFLPEKVAARKAIDAGEIGRPLFIADSRTIDYRAGTRPAWFLDQGVAGGGVLMNIGAHSVDRALWLMDGRARRVSATVVVPPGSGVETDALVRMEFVDGRAAQIAITSTGAPAAYDRLRIVGERGSLTVSPYSGTVLYLDGRAKVLHEPTEDDIAAAFAAQLAAFVDCVAGSSGPAVDGLHGRRVIEVILAAYAASAAGEPMVLDGQRGWAGGGPDEQRS
ncbi:Gfo/Idh/MocA family protein [Rugosimonospora africana]|uniref:Dehydrogenase n=1 Tax=Rugosimonospora africana TaxID=556532 RepID=A0A8J3VPN2_9ACTN|nr:Gfo/Idh/MocA family oxidoreductase [Rugosimonospora africana]GIH14260.1 dehydrogenase [Rugosimonospora africana]